MLKAKIAVDDENYSGWNKDDDFIETSFTVGPVFSRKIPCIEINGSEEIKKEFEKILLWIENNIDESKEVNIKFSF